MDTLARPVALAQVTPLRALRTPTGPATPHSRRPVAVPPDWVCIRAGDAEYTRALVAATTPDCRLEVLAPIAVLRGRCRRMELWVPAHIADTVAHELELVRAERAAHETRRTARRLTTALYPSCPPKHHRALEAAIACAVARPIRQPGERPVPRRLRPGPEQDRDLARHAAEQYVGRQDAERLGLPPARAPQQLSVLHADVPARPPRRPDPDEVATVLAAWASRQTAERSWGGKAAVVTAGPRCRLCGVLSGVSLLADGRLYQRHAQERLRDGLCNDCARSVAYHRAHGLRPPRPDPPPRGTRG
jgi:hypothetical protein